MENEHSTSQMSIVGDGNVIGDGSSSLVVKGVQIYTRSQVEELHDYLAQAVATYEARMYQLVARPVALPDQPYKFLYAFEIEDADIFFGRDAASEALYQTVRKDRLTILHAKSGTGKTSLLNAGLSPCLIREGRLPVYARAHEDPVPAIKRAIAPSSIGPWPELLPKLTLHEFLGLACSHSHQTQELVIILDQFEEFFVFWPEQVHRQPFIDALTECYDDKALPVRFVIGIRSDYFSHLATFQRRLPHVFHNEYYLEPMMREEAQAAITGPVAMLGRPVIYEQSLLDTLLDDLARGGIELPHLQIICTRLYEALATEKTSIPLALYERLGYAEGVLGSYLIKVLDKLPGSEAVIAKKVLKELISSEATRRVLAYDILTARVEAKRNELDDVLARLVHARLLRRDEVAGETTYEVVHEYLIREIKTWVDQRDLELKQVEELLARETVSWRTHGTPIPRDRLELLYTQRERLKGVNDEMWKCILQSALEADSSVLDWVRQAGDVGKRHLLKALSDTDVEKRKMVARVLGQLGAPCAVEPLATTLRDRDHKVRRVAFEALIKIGPPSVDSLIVALQDERHDTRFLAADALGAIGETRAIEPLIAVLEDNGEMGSIRQAAASALGKLNDPKAVEALVATLRVQDRDVYQTVVEILGQIGELAASSLIAALEEESASVRQAAVTLLAGSRNLCAVRGLVNALGDKDIKVRRAAAGALAKTGRPAVESLIATLHDRRRDVRWAAVRVLGEIGDNRAIEPLVVALEDKYEHVRFAAAEGLEKIGTPAALSALSALDDLRQKESND